MVNSRQKGKRGELDLCQALRSVMGWTVRRSQQFCGKAGDSDLLVEDHPDLFVECKLVQSLNVTATMKKAVEDAGDAIPAVFHRRDREEWLVTIRLTDLPRLLQTLGCGPLSKSKTGSSETTSAKPSLPLISPWASSLPPLESRLTPVEASDPESPSDST
jgi:hypothetical protein